MFDPKTEKYKGHTEGPLEAALMVNADGARLTKEEMKEYVCNCIEAGGDEFFFVSKVGLGNPDTCHTGNGPTSKINSLLYADSPALLRAVAAAAKLEDALEARDKFWNEDALPFGSVDEAQLKVGQAVADARAELRTALEEIPS